MTEEDDEYETQAQADARAGALRIDPVITLADNLGEMIVEYGVFNDPEFWDPLFASGEIAGELREQQLGEPMHRTGSLRSAVRFADLRNMERAEQGKVDKYGHVRVQVRTIVQSPWSEVSYDELDAARRR